MSVRLIFVLVLLVFAGCQKAAAPSTAEESRPELKAKLKQLLADRVASAKEARAAILAASQAETITMELMIWANESLYNAQLAAADTPDERIAVHVKRVQNFNALFEGINALYQVGARGGEQEKVAAAKYCLQSAEIALVEECLADGRSYPEFDPNPGVVVEPATGE